MVTDPATDERQKAISTYEHLTTRCDRPQISGRDRQGLQSPTGERTDSNVHSSGLSAATLSRMARSSSIAALVRARTSSGVWDHLGAAWGGFSDAIIESAWESENNPASVDCDR